MTNVTIYQFKLYDIASDEFRKSQRWATREVIETLGGQIIEESAAVVDGSVVGLGASSILGMTRRAFDPHVHAMRRARSA